MSDIMTHLQMADYNGTVFLYCRPSDQEHIGSFIRAAQDAGRQLLSREDCRELDPEALAKSPGKKVIFVSRSMIEFLDRYLDACPAGQRHLLIQVCREDEVCPMGYLFHDFWEERDIDIKDLCNAI